MTPNAATVSEAGITHCADCGSWTDHGLRCAHCHPTSTRADAVIEDVTWLLGYDSTTSIAHRLGYTNIGSLERMLLRWGRPDLAAHFRRSVAA